MISNITILIAFKILNKIKTGLRIDYKNIIPNIFILFRDKIYFIVYFSNI